MEITRIDVMDGRGSVEVVCRDHIDAQRLGSLVCAMKGIQESRDYWDNADVSDCSPFPWSLDEDSAARLRVVDARGDIVYEEDWSNFPDEMGGGMRESIILRARANARFMIDATREVNFRVGATRAR